MELMCEDGYRAHEHATQVVLPSGAKLQKQCRDVIGETIWVSEQFSLWEAAQSRLID